MTQQQQDTQIIKDLIDDFITVRKNTLELFKPLKIEDAVMQSDTFGSPPNWHLAHVTWFFHKVLEKYGRNLEHLRKYFNLNYLNSYYQRYGQILPKSERGRFPRPTVEETLKYRQVIEKEIIFFLKEAEVSSITNSKEIAYDIVLGNQHEMQHQELMVYDFQHYFQRFYDDNDNYLPTKRNSSPPTPSRVDEDIFKMVEIPGGLYDMGYGDKGFCYDNELPEHKVYLYPFNIDAVPVTNGQFMEFIEDGGYQNYKYWLDDGWQLVEEQKWTAPLYWHYDNSSKKWVKKDFRGVNEIDKDEPVVNVSYYEADAYCKWAGKRLPTEAEWEKAASWNEQLHKKTIYPWGDEQPLPNHANLLESYLWSPSNVGSYPEGKSYYGCYQMIGDVWEWTSSEYVLYPKFQSRFPEYTDKWAINQKVLRVDVLLPLKVRLEIAIEITLSHMNGYCLLVLDVLKICNMMKFIA